MRVALSIGNFDGVHRGHARLVAAAREAVGPEGLVRVLAFDPHPITLLRPDVAPRRLTTFDRRRDLLREVGADEVVAIEPTAELLRQEPATFIDGLVDRHHPSFIVEGPDFRFGRDRSGSIASLRAREGPGAYRTIVIDPVSSTLMGQQVVATSSTLVRWLLARGRVRDAAQLLGRRYELQCAVVPGDRRGRTLGMPTANLAHGDSMLPADGIYAGRGARIDGDRVGPALPAAISIGTKPTFGDRPRICEVHLVGYDGPVDDYGWTIRLEFLAWVREQIRYPDVPALRAQLDRDLAVVGALTARGA